jgi:hypothetical protein
MASLNGTRCPRVRSPPQNDDLLCQKCYQKVGQCYLHCCACSEKFDMCIGCAMQGKYCSGHRNTFSPHKLEICTRHIDTLTPDAVSTTSPVAFDTSSPTSATETVRTPSLRRRPPPPPPPVYQAALNSDRKSAIILEKEYDHPLLKRLTGMGYPRQAALDALEISNYDIHMVSRARSIDQVKC